MNRIRTGTIKQKPNTKQMGSASGTERCKYTGGRIIICVDRKRIHAHNGNAYVGAPLRIEYIRVGTMHNNSPSGTNIRIIMVPCHTTTNDDDDDDNKCWRRRQTATCVSVRGSSDHICATHCASVFVNNLKMRARCCDCARFIVYCLPMWPPP